MEIDLPYNWNPRPHQLPLWQSFAGGCLRGVVVWHRRAGKDSTALNMTCVKAHERVGVYWHMLPTQKQARRSVWNGIDREGRRIIDQVFPPVIRSRTSSQEMLIELKCGSIWQLCGSDNYNALVGSNPVGVIFSEWSLADPLAWDYIRPILAENMGWALFIYTPRGRNHGWEIYDMARHNPKWFCQRLTVDDTHVISEAAIQEERDAGMDEDKVQQEFYCSFDAALPGAYFGQLMNAADQSGRVTDVPYDPALPVHTAWDLGMSDSTSIWFMQARPGGSFALIDYYEAHGQGLEHYAKVLDDKGYKYGQHLAPHDIRVRELGTGKSRLETARSLGIRFDICPNIPVQDGINAIRTALPRCWFDHTRCKHGVDALRQYQREWNDKTRSFHDHPLHDWTSHAVDAFRYLCVGFRPQSGDQRGFRPNRRKRR